MPNKTLGQHFLNDNNILNLIADSALIQPEDFVVEIGPGKGSLTRVLAERTGKLTAIEIDSSLSDSLKQEFGPNVQILNADARNFDPATLFKKTDQYILLGNLPYYAALPILRSFLESERPPIRIVALVQREVAKLLCAEPGSMSLISVAFQVYGHLKILRNVKPGSFVPPPKVTSSIITLELRSDYLERIKNKSDFFQIVRAGFHSPRKQLKNSIASSMGLSGSEIIEMMNRAKVNPSRRAETLSIDEWISLHLSSMET
ncbi:MAG: ribosomal RNA small subunit methyltransferase A [Chloroflexi bacterium]|nr:ribosomal RNA small subunit methyltransferase A [Chloroflexota bacterium]